MNINLKQNNKLKTQAEALEKAQDYANNGNAHSMFQFLCESLIFESYKGYFSKKYPEIDTDEIHDTIGVATDELYVGITNGKAIRSIKNYLWKIIDNKLSKYVIERKRLKGTAMETIFDKPVISLEDRLAAEEQREKAINVAESLIPKLGVINVQNVMTYILGGIRNGAQHIGNDEIAEALDLTISNVKVAKKRGFERLARLAKESNLIDQSYNFTFNEEIEYYLGHEDLHDDPEEFDNNY